MPDVCSDLKGYMFGFPDSLRVSMTYAELRRFVYRIERAYGRTVDEWREMNATIAEVAKNLRDRLRQALEEGSEDGEA